MTDFDVAVVGAGVAGLAAARAVRAAGASCVVLEALSRIGGRAHTLAIGGDAFDAGASWLHAKSRNPLANLARSVGQELRDSDAAMRWRPLVDGRPATEAELADRARTEQLLTEVTEQALTGSDISLAAALDPIGAEPWLASLEMFEATLIAAADSRDLSLHDWRGNELEGGNLNVPGGLGAFVARHLAEAVRLDTPVSRIAWGDGVALDTPGGTVTARGAIVTVSTGVLRSERIAFSPGLPQTHLAALDGLPMGLLDKVVLCPVDEDRLGVPASTVMSNRMAQRHAPAMSFMAWPFGAGHVVGFVGAGTATELARQGQAAQFAFAREQLVAALGREAAAMRPELATSWSTDPAFYGAYAYARVGHAGARAALAAPLADRRLVFAGEAMAPDGLAGTVGGAWLSGRAAAAAVLAALQR